MKSEMKRNGQGQTKDPIRDSGGATYSRDIGVDRTSVFCDHPVLYYYLE